MTREEQQRENDYLYIKDQITIEEWRERFDELSSNRWTKEGKLNDEKKS